MPGLHPADASRKIPVRPPLSRDDEYCGTRFRSSRREARSIGTRPSNPASLPYGARGWPIGPERIPRGWRRSNPALSGPGSSSFHFHHGAPVPRTLPRHIPARPRETSAPARTPRSPVDQQRLDDPAPSLIGRDCDFRTVVRRGTPCPIFHLDGQVVVQSHLEVVLARLLSGHVESLQHKEAAAEVQPGVQAPDLLLGRVLPGLATFSGDHQ
ncbi:hypothetical protein STPH2_3150 [Streptomyces sp. KO7888]|nr:hypothetical protein STPH1_2834 [Streptomyces sp. OM5714]NHI07786.1 hypothetical protein [Streptomyces sp. KO7888]